MRTPDQCPQCGSPNFIALYADGSPYITSLERALGIDLRGSPLWDKCRCAKCGHEWPFRFIEIVEEKQ